MEQQQEPSKQEEPQQVEPETQLVSVTVMKEAPTPEQAAASSCRLDGAGLPGDEQPHQQEDDEACCFLCDRAAAPGSGRTALIAPCQCTSTPSPPLGRLMLVHRSCHNRHRRSGQHNHTHVNVVVFPNKRAFGRCLECDTPYVLQAAKERNRSPRKRLSLLFRDARDYLVGIVIVQGILGFFALLFWGVATALQAEEDGDSSFAQDDNSTDYGGDNTFLYDCETVRCVIGISYLGGVGLFALVAGLLGCGVYCLHDCNLDASVEAVGGRRNQNRGGGGGDGCCRSMDCRNCVSSGDCDSGDACVFLVILLALFCIVLAAIGFLFGCFVALVGIQALMQRYLWRIQYRRLLEEYPVRDRNSMEVACNGGGGGCGLETGDHDGYQELSQEDLNRLKDLGLLG